MRDLSGRTGEGADVRPAQLAEAESRGGHLNSVGRCLPGKTEDQTRGVHRDEWTGRRYLRHALGFLSLANKNGETSRTWMFGRPEVEIGLSVLEEIERVCRHRPRLERYRWER